MLKRTRRTSGENASAKPQVVKGYAEDAKSKAQLKTALKQLIDKFPPGGRVSFEIRKVTPKSLKVILQHLPK